MRVEAVGKLSNITNAVMHSNMHACWRETGPFIPFKDCHSFYKQGSSILELHETIIHFDQNTILVCVFLGLIYTAKYSNIQVLSDFPEITNQTDLDSC